MRTANMKVMLLLAAAAISSAAYADGTLTLSVTGGLHYTGLGLQPGYNSDYDHLDIGSLTTVTPIQTGSHSAAVELNPTVFTAGLNADGGWTGSGQVWTATRDITATFSEVGHADIVRTAQVSQDFSIVIGSYDTLTFQAGAPVTLDFDGRCQATLTPLPVTWFNDGSQPVFGQLDANVQYAAVPEATTMVLGLAATMPILSARRRRRA